MKTGELLQLFLQHKIVTTDTRSIPNNALFFALKGDKFNGNLFAKDALEKGAAYAIVDENVGDDPRLILVENVLEKLQDLARAYRLSLNIPFIGLTGSNGKTTSKELIAAVLKEKFKVHFTFGNLNNHIGVPLTILSIPVQTEIAVIEMGANHQKEIELLASISQPDFGYITNFGFAHLEGFGGFDGVVKGKSELYDFLRKNDRKVVINFDDELQVKQANGIQQITFSKSNQSDYQVELLDSDNEFLKVGFNDLEIQSNLTGDYNWSNLAAAITFGKIFGLEAEQIKKGIESYQPSNHRSQIIKRENYSILMDAYNANPSSMEVSLKNFSQFAGKKYVILGDMFELGNESEKNHQKIADLAISLGFDKILLIGKNFKSLDIHHSSTINFESREEVEHYLKNNSIDADYLLIKGSHGMRLDLLESIL